jgi:glutamate racemase
MNRLAIIDWGIGGFGFWKEWRKLRPGEGAIYFSDSGFTPYGKVPDDELADRLKEIIANLRNNHGITHCLIACHSASTVFSQVNCEGVAVSGIIGGTVDFIKATIPFGEVGLAGGRRTIESQTYHRLLSEYQVRGLIAQPLSAAVEAGRLHGPEMEALVSQTLKDSPSHLVLACTHYVALRPVIEKVFPGITLHDPIPSIASCFHQAWPEMDSTSTFLTSGSLEEMKDGAWNAFGVRIDEMT